MNGVSQVHWKLIALPSHDSVDIFEGKPINQV